MSNRALFRACVFGAVLMIVALVINLVVYLNGLHVPDQAFAVAGMIVLLGFFISGGRKYR